MTTRVRVAARESALMLEKGLSPLAVQGEKWTGRPRPKAWQHHEYGMVTHTSGRSICEKAASEKLYPVVLASRYYRKTHGTHYVCGYRGYRNGDLVQLANEARQANGVGINYSPKEHGKPAHHKNQYLSVVDRQKWKSELPMSLVARWQKRWPGYPNPLSLLPGTTTANSCYIHLELLPLSNYWRNEAGFAPMAPGLLFTKEQHDTVVALYIDIARRKKWRGDFWRTPRVLGHEDLTPLPRHDSRGGWDPGYLRKQPYFDWAYVERHINKKMGAEYNMVTTKLPKSKSTRFDKYTT